MTYSTGVKRALVLWTLLFSLVSAGVGIVDAAQPAANDPMRIIPADALFCLRINKLTTSLAQVDQFLTGLSPFGVSMPVRSQLGQFLGQPEPAGINMAGDIAVFGPLPGGEKPDLKRLGMLIPLSDFQQFLTNPNVAKPDAQGILKIGPEGKLSLAGVQMGSYLLLTGVADQQALTEAKNWTAAAGAASLAQRLGAEELKRATDAPAWIYANVQIANKLFGPMIQQKIKEVQASVQKQAASQPFAGQPQAVMQMYASLLDSLMRETQFVSIALDPSATAVRLAFTVAAVPNTEMAKTLGTDNSPQPRPNLLGYLDNGAAMNGVVSLRPALLKTVTLKYMDLFTAMMGAAAAKEDVAKFGQLLTDSMDAVGGTIAWSFSANLKSKPPFEVKYVAALKDKQKFYQVLEQSSRMMSEGAIADLYQKLGLKMRFDLKRNVETYKDVPIDSIHFTMQPADTNTPNAPMQMQMMMMKTMLGEGFDLRLAIVNDLLLYTLAADPETKIHTLIDQVKAGGPTQIASEVQAALSLLPDAQKAQVFGTYNIVRLMQMGMAFAPIPIPPVDASSQSGIAFAGDVGGGKLLVNVAIPKQHVQELMQLVMSMQQKMQSKPPQEGPKQDL